MEALIELIPQIGSVFSLVAFIFAGYFLLQRNKLKQKVAQIEAAKEEDRAELIKEFKSYTIPKGEDNLTPDHKFKLMKSQIDIQRLKTIFTFVFGLAMLLLVGWQISNGGDVPVPDDDGPTMACSQWKSNLDIINSTYQGLGTGEKTYVNKERTIQKLTNLELESNAVLEKEKNNLISLLRTAPKYSDPNYNIEFTQEAKLLRDQLKMGIQKEVNKCN
jgi:hypothetical protein